MKEKQETYQEKSNNKKKQTKQTPTKKKGERSSNPWFVSSRRIVQKALIRLKKDATNESMNINKWFVQACLHSAKLPFLKAEYVVNGMDRWTPDKSGIIIVWLWFPKETKATLSSKQRQLCHLNYIVGWCLKSLLL